MEKLDFKVKEAYFSFTLNLHIHQSPNEEVNHKPSSSPPCTILWNTRPKDSVTDILVKLQLQRTSRGANNWAKQRVKVTLDNLALHILCHFSFPMYFLDYKHLNINKIAWLSRILMFTIFLFSFFIKSSIKMIVITLTTLMSLVDLALSPSLNWMTSAASTRTSDIILILILLCHPHHPHHPPFSRHLLHPHLHPLLVRFTFKVKWLPFGRMHAARKKLVLSKFSK